MSEKTENEKTAPEIVDAEPPKVEQQNGKKESEKVARKDEVTATLELPKKESGKKKGFFESLEDEWYGDDGDRGA